MRDFLSWLFATDGRPRKLGLAFIYGGFVSALLSLTEIEPITDNLYQLNGDYTENEVAFADTGGTSR